MSVRVAIPAYLQSFTDSTEAVEVEGNTIGECLSYFIQQFPNIERKLFDKNGKLHSYLDIYVNELAYYPEGMTKQIKDGDELYIVFLIAGG